MFKMQDVLLQSSQLHNMQLEAKFWKDNENQTGLLKELKVTSADHHRPQKTTTEYHHTQSSGPEEKTVLLEFRPNTPLMTVIQL